MSYFEYALPASEKRKTAAISILKAYRTKMSEQEFAAICRELWLDQYISYGEMGQLLIDVTDLQLIALASAMVSFVESGGSYDESIMCWGGRELDQVTPLVPDLPF